MVLNYDVNMKYGEKQGCCVKDMGSKISYLLSLEIFYLYCRLVKSGRLP